MQETLVRSKGYPLETHEVATQDGYLLQMHRILHGRDGHCGANETGMACCERGPVFVMTGLLADSASLVLDFPKQSLGYVLADNGYDVWLGNVRGTTYGKKHKELEVKSKKFWNFSFHEHAIFDVPANIDYILRETKRKDLLYIGMSQGTLTFFTMLAEKPWYNDKIKAFIGLAPFYKLGHLKVPPLAVFSPHAEAPLRQAYAAGSYEVLPQGMPIAGFVRHFCGHATRGICSYLADNFANFGSRYINELSLLESSRENRGPVTRTWTPGVQVDKRSLRGTGVLYARPPPLGLGPCCLELAYSMPGGGAKSPVHARRPKVPLRSTWYHQDLRGARLG
ncbi:lipase 3-like [Rhipicephalus microplus]|uniref:lipase 3-like n=1 Tax=Rhipicephalus microplus TaxID=6941 RepID=UPI003F6B1EEC